MTPTVTIRETAAVGVELSAVDVRDPAHVRRLLLQSAFSVSGDEGKREERSVPVLKLALLRSFLSSQGCGDKTSARNLLLLALLELEDEDESRRLYVPSAILPKALPPL